MLLVGVGGIGAEAARLAAAFGMRVIGVDARRREAPPAWPSSTAPTRSTRCCRERTSWSSPSRIRRRRRAS
jgi:NAD(P)-dependent dehydrogenase (short-subunit alcohol dehydrogenase family)